MVDWLPPEFGHYAIIILGLVAAVMGFTGLVRHETGALSHAERSTPLGRIVTPILSTIWLITGIILIASRLLPDPQAEDLIGYTSLIAAISFVGALLFTLLYYVLPLPHKRAHSLITTRIVLPPTAPPRFRRLDRVSHPEHGRGIVLAMHHGENSEMVAVRFRDYVYTLPATSLDPIQETITPQ